ncbi:MAG: hypothetical protein IPI92_12245 [Gemmatimonadetes bacterium]|nr:hypothetical protein [Gemmatimonadota bacterium]MBK7785777.1 hypothetical protein [Gemmatimonadota bacterium]MBK9067102.1 hypothetical protein [Gemmatimonadota bacterium]
MAEVTFKELVLVVRAAEADVAARVHKQALERPHWLSSLDARATSLQSQWNVLRYAELSLCVIDKHLSASTWWTSLRGEQLQMRQVEFEYTAYSQGSKFGAFHLATAAFENSVRSLLRHLDPTAANNSRAEFKGVYECLLRTHLHLPERDLTLCDLMRLVRNTIHNEGVHRPPNTLPATISYDGVTYEFTDSTPLEFVTWQFVLSRIANLIELLDRAIRTEPLWSASGHIEAAWAAPAPDSAA